MKRRLSLPQNTAWCCRRRWRQAPSVAQLGSHSQPNAQWARSPQRALFELVAPFQCRVSLQHAVTGSCSVPGATPASRKPVKCTPGLQTCSRSPKTGAVSTAHAGHCSLPAGPAAPGRGSQKLHGVTSHPAHCGRESPLGVSVLAVKGTWGKHFSPG